MTIIEYHYETFSNYKNPGQYANTKSAQKFPSRLDTKKADI